MAGKRVVGKRGRRELNGRGLLYLFPRGIGLL
jgi:hypothetical protein